MYTFYDEGFFGYGEPGDFEYFTLAHFMPIIILVLSLIYVFINREKIRNWKYEARLRFIIAFILMIVEMSYYWRVMYVGDDTGRYLLLGKLPLELCEWGSYCAIFMLTSKNKALFNYNFYVSLLFAVAAMITPTVIIRTGPTYYRYYQFWLVHSIPVFATVYMMFVHKYRPSYKALYIVTAVLVCHALICIQVNKAIPGANYMYLAGFNPNITMGDNPINYLPHNPYLRMLSLLAIALVLFNLLYQFWTRLLKNIDN